jgi:hypothetical protein
MFSRDKKLTTIVNSTKIINIGVRAGYIDRIKNLFSVLDILEIFPLTETTGTTITGSINNYVGTSSGLDLSNVRGPGSYLVMSPYFSGQPDYISLTSAGYLNSYPTFGAEGSEFIWAKASDSSIWSDGLQHLMLQVTTAAVNTIRISKTTTNDTINILYKASNVSQQTNIAMSGNLDWVLYGLTWSKSNNRVRFYINGLQQGADATGLGTWSATPPTASNVCIGALTSAGSSAWKGWLSHATYIKREITPTEVLNFYNLFF